MSVSVTTWSFATVQPKLLMSVFSMAFKCPLPPGICRELMALPINAPLLGAGRDPFDVEGPRELFDDTVAL